MDLFGSMPDLLLFGFGVLVIVAGILILASGRRDDDVGGTRTQMRYAGTIGIVTLYIVLFAFFAVVQSLTQFMVDGHVDNELYRSALTNGLLLITAGVVFVFHYARAQALAPAGKLARGATGAAARATLYGVCFVAALVALAAAAKAVYGIFVIIAPGVFGSGQPDVQLPAALQGIASLGGDTVGGQREQGIADFVSYAALAVGAVFIFLRGWNWLPEHRK